MKKGDAAKVAVRTIASYRSQVSELEEEHEALLKDRESVLTELGQVRKELSEALLPSARPEVLERVVAETGATFLPEQRGVFEAHRAECAEKLQEILAQEDFQQRGQLLGSLVTDLREARDQHERLMLQLAPFDENKHCRWILNRMDNPKQGAFSSFWRAITFAETREQAARNKAAAQLGYSDWAHLKADYDRCQADTMEAHARLEYVELRHTSLTTMIKEHDDYQAWVNNFEERLAQELRFQLTTFLESLDVAQLYRGVRPSLQHLTARMHGLAHKALYLSQLSQALEVDIADRSKRGRQVDSARVLWERKPWDQVGDKTKWLVALPAMKQESTTKKVRWTRSVRRNVVAYSDWDDYQIYHDQNPGFLPYDAFAWGSDDPMPYEGFTRQVFRDLDQHRRQNVLATPTSLSPATPMARAGLPILPRRTPAPRGPARPRA